MIGAASLDALLRTAPTLERFDTEPLVLEHTQSLQFLCETETAGAQALLPAGLHPTIPGAFSILVQHVPASPFGAFSLAQVRIECRSGVRPRAFLLLGWIDNAAAGEALGSRFAYRLAEATVRLERNYDEVSARVERAGRTLLALRARRPQPLGVSEVQYVANMHLAHTPRGPRLVQVDPEVNVERAERGVPEVVAFAGEALGAPGLEARLPISASFTVGRVTLPRLRFLCAPDRPAFEGTERVEHQP